jgi:hypothetical protein
MPVYSWASYETERFNVGPSTISVTVGPEVSVLPMTAIMDWVKLCARAVTKYYGRFPVPDCQLTILTEDSGHIHHGVEYRGRQIHIDLGQDTSREDLTEDWQLTHEMFHLSFPLLDDDYDWMGEGLSDYVEPIARARIGALSDESVWRDLVEGLPKGLPDKGDGGLDGSETGGRVYWGGVLYWLLADLKIREETHNQKSLRDALKAILDAGGDGRHYWELDRVLAVGDKATGTTVLHDLHEQMGSHPYTPDLNALWKRLGVVYQDRGVSFDDSAPDAALRKAVTAPSK